jgi:hypothetical protein
MNRIIQSLLAVCMVLSVFGIDPRTVEASVYGQPEVTINGGGGVLTNGSDGLFLKLNTINGAVGGEQMCWRNENYYDDPNTNCADDASAMTIILTILDTSTPADTETFNSVRDGSAHDGMTLPFDSLTISNRTGSARPGYESTTGDGSAMLTYTATVGAYTYTVKRTITYIYPNQHYIDDFEVIVPAGNPSNKVVKLYKGADVAPGGNSDGEKGFVVQRPALPATTLVLYAADSNSIIGVREIPKETGMSTVDGMMGDFYQSQFFDAWQGNDISFNAFIGDPTDDTDTEDTGYLVQWTIGSTPGTYTRDLETFVAQRGVNVTAAWSGPTIAATGRLDFTVTSSRATRQTGLGFVFTAPSPSGIVGSAINGCTGSSTTVSGSVLTVSGLGIDPLTSCVISINVGSSSTGTVSITKANVTVSGSNMINAVGSITTSFGSATISTSTPTVTAISSAATATLTPHPYAILDVDVGASFTLVVLNNGTLVTWGFNRQGQTTIPRWMASRLFTRVETGSNYALALGQDGRVYGWGVNNFGQLNIPRAALRDVTDISASLGHAMALKVNGDLVIWGRNDFRQLNAPLSARKGLSGIAAGHSHSLAIKGGKVIAWGRNTWSQTNIPRGLSDVVAVAGGFDHSMALKSNGTVVCWGRNNDGQCNLPRGMKDVVAISAGVGYSLAMTRDGTVYGWGRNDLRQSRIPRGVGRAGAIAAGYVNSVIGQRDAKVVTFGESLHGALVSRTPTVTP